MPATPTLEVRTLPLAAVTPADYNPRLPLGPADPAYRKLRRSIEAFGLVEPLVWNQRSGRLVGGHARLGVLRDLGYTDVPVAVVDLPDDAEKALNVVLNNPAAQGRYDARRLAEVLGDLDGLSALDDSGFGPAGLRALRLEPVADPEPEPEPARVEVLLTTDPATFGRLEAELDALVTRYDLQARVRRR